MAKIQVFIVDDHPVVCEGIRHMLEVDSDIQVVGEAYSGEEATAKIPSVSPDIVLMDVRLPSMDGIEAVRYLKRICPGINIIVLTSYGDEYLAQAVEAGATGYLLKKAGRNELVRAVRATSKGESPIDPSLSRELLTEFVNLAAYRRKLASSSSRLAPRETKILGYVAQGNSNKQIAHRLGLSEQTVKNYLTSIMSKLHASDRTQAVVIGLRKRLISI